MTTPPGWTNWPQPSQHSPIDLEHRLTSLESTTEQHGELHEESDRQISAHDRRLNLHEKAILGIFALLQVLMQDKYPALAEAIKKVVMP